MRTYISIAIFASMTLLGANSIEAQNHRGTPMGFSNFDTNEDNIISEKEFNDMKSEMSKNKKGKEMKITFSDIDKDADGKVTIKEFDTFHAEMVKSYKGNKKGKRKGSKNSCRNDKGQRGMNSENMFAKIDADSDKFISEKELNTFREERMKVKEEKGKQMKNADKAPTFESLDLDKDGKISESEFLSAHKKMTKNNKNSKKGRNNMKPNIPEFKDLDKDRNGMVSEEEYIEFRQARMKAQADKGGQMKNAANAPTFESIDTNKDGNIDETEFENHKKKNCKRGN